MIPTVHNRVRETTTTTGASNISLLGASVACKAISGRYAVNESLPYHIVHQTASEWESGIGHLASSTVLVRDTVNESSNADTLVSFSTGTKDVFIDVTAGMLNALSAILYGTAAPTTEGSDGDFYIRTTTNYLYGPKAAGTWPAGTALVGTAGATGPAGNTVLYGAAAPTTEGANGDFYIRTTTNYLYGPKAAGTWPAGTSLVGATGAAGAGVVAGGTVNQVLQKISGADFDTGWVTLAGGGNALTANPLSQFAATTSAQLAGVISDETGSGALVFATSPTLVTPILGTPTSGTLTNCTFPTLNQNTTGTAAGLSGTALAGDVTNSGNTVTVTKVNGTSFAALATGILKNTTTTGVPSIAAAGTDYVVPGGALGTPASGTLTNCTFPATVATTTGAQTLTNKRVSERVSSNSNVTSLSVDSDLYDIVVDTGLTAGVTCNNPTGTPTEGQCLIYKLTGTAARAITWGANFAASTVTLPTTTVTTAMLTVGFMWNVASSKWVCVGAV